MPKAPNRPRDLTQLHQAKDAALASSPALHLYLADCDREGNPPPRAAGMAVQPT